MINSIINGDNVETLKTFPENCIDLTVTSPPYDNLRTYKGHTWDFEGVANELFRVTKQGGVVVWVVGDATINGSETGTSFRQALYFMSIGFRLFDTMIFRKSGVTVPLSNKYYPQFEYMFVFSKGNPNTFNPISDVEKKYFRTGKRTQRRANGTMSSRIKEVNTNLFYKRGNVWEYKTGYMLGTKDKIAFKHPATFPEQLAKDHITSWSNEGDLVLDPFCGSGTTCKMAKILNRNYIGIEVAKEYCEIAEQRINQYNKAC